MHSLSDRFDTLRQRGERALVLFVTGGDQPLEELPGLLECLQEGGADAIEVGIPFSDPFGEGPTIQASSQRALDQGATTSGILAAIGRTQLEIPIVTMGYYNPVLRFGLEAFAKASREAGVTGTIISDLIPDESDAWGEASRAQRMETIFLAAPTSTDHRIEEVARRSTGFVYAVSRTGVTGAESTVPPEVRELVVRIREHTQRPICVGFGISKPQHVRMVCEVADGAVVGSALVTLLHQEWRNGRGRDTVLKVVRDLKAATRV